jgi:alpha-mannosidase
VITHGGVWLTVECLVGWQHTRASIRLTFYADLPHIDIDTRLYMQARRKMLKLQFPLAIDDARAVNEVPYGLTDRPTDATEYPCARWVRIDSADGFSVGIANNGVNGFDASSDGVLNMSVSRGGTHCSWSEQDVPLEKSYTFMDQTQIDTRFRLIAGERAALEANLPLTAAVLNQPLERFFTYTHATLPADAPAQSPAFLTVKPPQVTLAALKQSANGQALIVRLQETAGTSVEACVQLEGDGERRFAFTPHALRTWRVTRGPDGALDWQACNLLEEPLT